MLGLLGFGAIAAEVINSFKLFAFRVEVPFVAVPLILIFVFSELVEKRLADKADIPAEGRDRYRRIIAIHYLILALLFIALVVSVPLVWWGAIKKLATMANQGKIAY